MAKANIQRAMAMLDPEECARRYELPIVWARETCPLEQVRIETFDQLVDICRRGYEHMYRRVFVANTIPPADMVRGTVWDILEHHYQGGAEAAYKAARHGFNGGLPGVLDAFRDYFMKDMEAKYFDHVLMECVDVMDLEDIETLMEQYRERYGRHMDGDHLPSAKFLASRYKEIIRAHSQVVRRLRTYFGR